MVKFWRRGYASACAQVARLGHDEVCRQALEARSYSLHEVHLMALPNGDYAELQRVLRAQESEES